MLILKEVCDLCGDRHKRGTDCRYPDRELGRFLNDWPHPAEPEDGLQAEQEAPYDECPLCLYRHGPLGCPTPRIDVPEDAQAERMGPADQFGKLKGGYGDDSVRVGSVADMEDQVEAEIRFLRREIAFAGRQARIEALRAASRVVAGMQAGRPGIVTNGIKVDAKAKTLDIAAAFAAYIEKGDLS